MYQQQMSTSNQLFRRNLPGLRSQLSSWKKENSIDKSTYGLSKTSIKKHSYVKMIIESCDRLNKSQAVEFLRQASSTESKLSLLDAMKDKVSLSTKEIDELVPSTNSSSSSSMTDVSSLDNLSCLSLLLPQQQQFPHLFTSFNNAAQPATRRSSNENKRSSLLHHLFGRHSSKKSASIVKQPLKIPQQTTKRRIISSGDQVKLPLTKVNHLEKSSYDINIQGDTIDNRRTNKGKIHLPLQGLCYDFKQIKNISSIKQPSQADFIPIPFTSRSSFVQDKSLSSLSDPTSMRQHIKEQKQNIQSAHGIDGIPKIKSTNTTLEKISLNPDQHKYRTQTSNYNYPKRLSAIELLAKQYTLPLTLQNSTGLFWYNSTHQETMNKPISFSKHIHNSPKRNNRSNSSSDSRDTSSSSNTSSSSSSTSIKAPANKTSSNSSTTSSSQKSSSDSNTQSKRQKTIKQSIGQYNRNQNDKDDIIRIDVNSSTSQTSTSTSASMHRCHQRFVSRKQSSNTSSSTTTTNNSDNTSSLTSSSSSPTTTTNTNKSINIPPTSD